MCMLGLNTRQRRTKGADSVDVCWKPATLGWNSNAPMYREYPPRETYTQRNACTLFEIYIYKDWCTHAADRYSRRCWTSFRLLVLRKPTTRAGLATVHTKVGRGKKKKIGNCYYLFSLVLNINDHLSLSSLKWMLTAQNVWLLWYDWGDQTKSSQTHTLYANFGLFSRLSLFYDSSWRESFAYFVACLFVRSIFHRENSAGWDGGRERETSR
jgi:hypothetical protein